MKGYDVDFVMSSGKDLWGGMGTNFDINVLPFSKYATI
jgi:hypothetical protein